jgi:multicomponent K+:H+ antiporter subunit G
MSVLLPSWVEGLVVVLLVASGLLSLVAAFGIVRLDDFFQRLHAPALANTLAAWCSALASMAFMAAATGRPTLAPVVLNVLLAITAPITTALLARAALFRRRRAGDDLPPPLGSALMERSQREGRQSARKR